MSASLASLPVTKLVLNYASKSVEWMETPAPKVAASAVLVETLYSAVSLGTESMMVRLARKSLLSKAVSRPDLVRKVIQKVQTDGLTEAYRQSAARLEEYVPLGYSSVGRVVQSGARVGDLRAGDLVACAGQNIASHGQLAHVPRTMCAPVPPGVPLQHAAFAGIAAVGLNAIRLSNLDLGGVAAVVGLGLIGQLTARLLSAAGMRVVGCDPSPGCRERLNGVPGVSAWPDAAAMLRAVRSATSEHGADAVLLCAARENDPSLLASCAEACRLGGSIVAVGLTPLRVPRKMFYEKELRLLVSRSFGPGVYETEYEAGRDYPYPHVRWTVARNLACFLDLLDTGRLDLSGFVDLELPFDSAQSGYVDLVEGENRAFAAVFTYPQSPSPRSTPGREPPARLPAGGKLKLGFIGGGTFARSTLLPELESVPSADLRVICSGSGEQAAALRKRYGFAQASSDAAAVMADPGLDAVVIANRHSSHAAMVVAALEQGKHVFVEKPLALSLEELHRIAEALATTSGSLMVGFNRRFAPDYVRLREWFRTRTGQGSILYRINAGWLPATNWVMDVGEGGRFLGELCHYVDLAMDLAASPLARVYASSPQGAAGGDFSVTLEFEAPIVATLAYTSSGHRRVSRERLEAFRGESVAVIDNYTRCEIHESGGRRVWRHFGAQRGHREELRAWVDSLLRSGRPPAPERPFLASTEANLLALQSALTGQPVADFQYQ